MKRIISILLLVCLISTLFSVHCIPAKSKKKKTSTKIKWTKFMDNSYYPPGNDKDKYRVKGFYNKKKGNYVSIKFVGYKNDNKKVKVFSKNKVKKCKNINAAIQKRCPFLVSSNYNGVRRDIYYLAAFRMKAKKSKSLQKFQEEWPKFVAKKTLSTVVVKYAKSLFPSYKGITDSMIRKALVEKFPALSIPVSFASNIKSAISLAQNYYSLIDNLSDVIYKDYYLLDTIDFDLDKSDKKVDMKKIDKRIRRGCEHVKLLYDNI